MKKLIFWMLSTLLLSITVISSALPVNDMHHKHTVNILTWWGYLNYPEIISAAENKCNVTISFDEYYSNDEFLRRWEGQSDFYHIIIFSDTIYNSIKNKIPRINNSTLYRQAANYHPIIKARYYNRKYPHNVVYFFHSMTGFLWNPNNIALSSEDSVTSIFNKAGHRYVVIMDDPIEVKKLIETSINEGKIGITPDNAPSMTNFKKVMQNTSVYISNNYSLIYEKPEFAFSYRWTGEAIFHLMESNKGYKFLIHPKLSYISSDLIAQTSSENGAFCVADFLSSKKITSVFQNKVFYFSPYVDYSDIQNPIFKDIYKSFYTALPKLTWIDSVKRKDFQLINESWQLIKLSLNNHSD